MRILVVDDDQAGRDLLDVALSAREWEIDTAGDGVEALELARARRYDVVVSDILMPRMDGHELCRQWKADRDLGRIPFIFYTGTYTQPEDEEYALSLGADGFIVKPTEPSEFARIVEPLVHLHGSRPQVDMPLEIPSDVDSMSLTDLVPEIIRDAPVAIVVMDLSGRPLHWNDEAERMLGMRDVGAAAREHLEHTHDSVPEEFGEAMGRLLGGETLHGFEMRSRDESGTPRYLLLTGGPLRHGDKGVGIIAIVDDITERRVAEDELVGHRERLEELVEERTRELVRVNQRLKEGARAKSAFVAGMGHEMRNHLNSIIGFSGIMLEGLDGELSAEQRTHIAAIYASGQSLLALVNDVTDLSKIEAGQLEVSVAQFELLGFLEEVAASFRPSAMERGISLVLDAPYGVIPMNSDQAKLEQVVRNLVSNALKFTQQGAVRIEVEQADDRTTVVMRVRDTGEGIPAEAMPRIFDEFVKEEPSGGEASGTGLGLSITRRLCEMLGGSVSARSNAGEGSVFTVVIPTDIGTPDTSAAARGDSG